MKKAIFFIILFIEISFSYAKNNNEVSILLTYPFQTTNHYYVNSWGNGFNFNGNYKKNYKSFFQYGIGLNYTYLLYDYGVQNTEGESTFQEITPYIIISKKKLYNTFFNPFLEIGSSFLYSNNKNYKNNNISLYMSPGLTIDYSINKNLSIGFSSSYKVIFQNMNFDTGVIPANIITANNDDFISYITLGICFSFSF